MGVYLGAAIGNDYRAMRGPCPQGFHIPSSDEWQGVLDILEDLLSQSGYGSSTVAYYLHLPLAWVGYEGDTMQFVDASDSHFDCTNPEDCQYGIYRTSTYTDFVYMDTSIEPEIQCCGYEGTAAPIRAFSDSYIAPDASWDVSYGTLGSAGIFHNHTLGVISITDGSTNNYTIADKNVGATVLYNITEDRVHLVMVSDPFSTSNVGLYFQRGNNYGFPLVWGSEPTSIHTPDMVLNDYVDASGYGPSEYSSSTFINSNIVYDIPNEDLRGGQTGVTVSDGSISSAYIGAWPELVTEGGIYWNESLGLISIFDGTNTITISDKNLGTIEVFNTGDTAAAANSGNLFQWGNNYPFPWNNASSITKSSTAPSVSGYGPGNYYRDSTFITGATSFWGAANNTNMRGGTTGTNAAKQGPCPEGYHLPSKAEWVSLFEMGDDVGAWTWNSSIEAVSISAASYLKLPTTSGRYNNSCQFVSTGGYYRCADGVVSSQLQRGNYLGIVGNLAQLGEDGGDGYSVRAFKNEPVVPDVTRTVLYHQWQPGANTLLYMKFNDNLNDDSGNNNTMTGSGIGYETVSGDLKCVKTTSVDGTITGPGNLMSSIGTGDFTVSYWIYPVSSPQVPLVFGNRLEADPGPGVLMFMVFGNGYNMSNKVGFFTTTTHASSKSASSLVGGWHLFTFTRVSGVCHGYIDGSEDFSSWSDSTNLTNVDSLIILSRNNQSDQKRGSAGAKMSELIVEKKGWTADEVTDYYNQTKSIYGIS